MTFHSRRAVGFLGLFWVATAVSASCPGLSSGAIPAKFSAAFESCAPATESPGPIALEPEPIRTMADIANTPATARIAYAAPARTRRTTIIRRVAGVPEAVLAVSRRYRIDPVLLHAIIARESAFRQNAVSRRGALGLMQIMPGTARGLGVSDPAQLLTDPALNLAAGATYLKQLQRQFGNDVPTVLAAYNAGPGAVRRYRGTPPYAETRSYVRSIMARYRQTRGEFAQ